VQATTTLSKVALVIGNDEYGGDLGLTHAVSSAHAVAERLTELEYSVVSVSNAALADLQPAFEAFRDSLSAGCSVIIYYCGHGWQGMNSVDCLLVPVDFAGANPAGASSISGNHRKRVRWLALAVSL
jgi:uncharacterized caspase-like protein